MTTRSWVDWVNIILGLWLVTSPWFVALNAGETPAAWNLSIVGIAVVALAALSMYKPAFLVNAFGIIVGMWLVASPWVLGFSSLSGATTNAVVVGILIMGYALWAMCIDFVVPDATLPFRHIPALRISK